MQGEVLRGQVQFKSEPLTPPKPSDVRVIGDTAVEATVMVLVGEALVFRFDRSEDGASWVAGHAITAVRGAAVDEHYLSVARDLASTAMRGELARAAGEPVTMRCPHCRRLMSVPHTAAQHGAPAEWECGPVHTLHWKGVSAVGHPDGRWEVATDDGDGSNAGHELQLLCERTLRDTADRLRKQGTVEMSDFATALREALLPIVSQWSRTSSTAEVGPLLEQFVRSGEQRVAVDFDGLAAALQQPADTEPAPAAAG